MKLNLRKKIYTGFFIASVLIGLLSYFYLKSNRDFIQSSEAVHLSTMKLRQLERVLSLLKDAETGERGYIITQKEPFLQPYDAATQGLDNETNQLKQMIGNDPYYQNIYPKLDSLIDVHIAFLDGNIRSVKQGRVEPVVQIVISGQGKRLLDAIRNIIGDMQQNEEKRLQVLRKEEDRDVFINYLVNFSGIALTLILFGTGFWVITSDLSKREKLEKDLLDKNEQLATLNEELESALEESTAANDKIKEYTQILEDKNNTLEDLNQQLEAFSYTISHDLQSPLHTIAGYARLLSEDPVISQHAETLRQAEIIETNALRMDTLINDLLRFARIGKTAVKKSPSDMNKIVQQVISQLQEYNNLNNYTLKLANLPEVAADKKLMHQVWFNLIGNAIKFSARTATPVIEIGCEQNREKVIFYIKDNGIGFDPKGEDPFGVFKRLHSAEAFEGNGIGLAIVQRIIKQHGGEVWAESAPSEGATFYVTLPR
jgi:signal transduction histidine kinase